MHGCAVCLSQPSLASWCLCLCSNNPDRALVSAFKTLGDMCEKLNLVNAAIKDGACDLYKRALESGRLRGRGMMVRSAREACMWLLHCG